MRIRTTTGPGASPPPGPMRNSDDQTTPWRMGTRAPGVSLAEGHTAAASVRLMVPIMTVTPMVCGGDQW
jgi:hypothetical protein